VATIDLAYAGPLEPTWPRRLFYKSTKRRPEATFNRWLAAACPPGLLARCFHASFEVGPECTHLLFEDLAATHVEPEPTLPPPLAEGESLVDDLAAVHATFWHDPRSPLALHAFAEDCAAFVTGQAREALPRLIDHLGDRLPPERRAFCERAVAIWPGRVARRAAEASALSVVHGDCHGWNYLRPLGLGGRHKLIDWEDWYVGRGTDDVAFFFAPHSYPDRRRRLERALVARYHRALEAGGVRDYPFAACWLDYRGSVLTALLKSIFHFGIGSPPSIWWHNFERGFAAAEELDCRELLG
jgi:hypothetical protein